MRCSLACCHSLSGSRTPHTTSVSYHHITTTNEDIASGQLCTSEETKRCMKTVEGIVQYEGVPFFGNAEELEKVCESYTVSLRCMERFSQKCLSEKRKKVMAHFMDGPKKFITNLCQEGEYKKSFLKLSSCFKSNHNASLQVCTAQFAQQLLTTKMQQNSNSNNDYGSSTDRHKLGKVFHNTCQALVKFRQCGKKIAEKHCGEKSANFFGVILLDITGPLVRSACRHKLVRTPVQYMLRKKMLSNANGGDQHQLRPVYAAVIAAVATSTIVIRLHSVT